MAGGLGSSLAPLGDVSGGSGASGSSGLSDTISEGVVMAYAEPLANRRYAPTNTEAGGVHDGPPTYLYRLGALVSDVIRANATTIPALKYAQLLAERGFITEALARAAAAKISDVIQVHPSELVVRALIVAEALGLHDTLAPGLKYGQLVAQGIGVHDKLTRFLGGALVDGIGIHDTLTRLYRVQPTMAENVGVHETTAIKMLLRVTASDSIRGSTTTLLKAIYNGTLADGIEISAGFISPAGNFTAWAMNARTAAVTEYRNFAFNSFAQLGSHYLAASDDGLYTLDGDTDDGTDIVATIRSGMAQFSGTHLGRIKAVYLAARGDGDFLLKIVSGDGFEAIYGVVATSRHTTKIHLGKGLRARYFAFELVSAGQDFDLDTLEFVPLTVQRRV